MVFMLSKRLFPLFCRHAAIRRPLVALAVTLLLFLLSGLAARFLLPALLKPHIEKLISEKLHRPAAVGAIGLNPFTLEATLRGFKLMEPDGKTLFAAFETLYVDLSWQSMARRAPVVQELRLTKPYVRLVRGNANRYNIDDIAALIAAQPASPQPARFSINNIQLEGGRIDFEDLPAQTRHTVADIRLGVPFVSSLPNDVQVFVQPLLSATINGRPLAVGGKVRPFAATKEAQVELKLDDVDVPRYLGYLPFKPNFNLQGARLDARLAASFRQAANAGPALSISGAARLRSLALNGPDGRTVLKVPELNVTLREADPLRRRIDLSRIVLDGAQAELERGRDGVLNLQRLLEVSPATSAGTAARNDGAGWRLSLAELDVHRAAIRYADPQSAAPMQAHAQQLELAVRKLVLDTGGRTVSVGSIASDKASLLMRRLPPAGPQPGQTGDAPGHAGTPKEEKERKGSDAAYAVTVGDTKIENWSARLEDGALPETAPMLIEAFGLTLHRLSTGSSTPARVAMTAAVNRTGRLRVQGEAYLAPLLAPLRADLAIKLDDIDLLPLQPYVADKLNLRLGSGTLSSMGRLQLAVGKDGGLAGGFTGSARLGNLAAANKTGDSDFLRWKALALEGLDLKLAPLSLAVNRVALDDFFARIVIDRNGRINLQDIVQRQAQQHKETANAHAPAATLAGGAGPARSPQAGTAASADGIFPVRIAQLAIRRGTVRFSDNFIRPNYSARLMDLSGTITGLSSDPSSTAAVDLHGEVNDAPLSIAGFANPLRGDLLLDLTAKVHGMELASLSPYSSRYLGYGIEKGKLSFEAAYRVENRKLAARNRLVLDQLTFGRKSGSPAAMNLPVEFAIALLQDRNGVIDIDVPVDGSLDDPKFSIGGVVFKALGNAIAKAVTRPFALLGSLFGHGGAKELASLPFEAGRATLPADGEARMAALAKALLERPALKLEIAGLADRASDAAGLQRALVERKVRAIKLKELRSRDESAKASGVVIKDDEYPRLLAQAYKEEKFEKPRNFLGLPKALPVEEMERQIIAHSEVDDDDFNALCERRARAVRDWLVEHGHVPVERLFILAPRIDADSGQAEGAARVRSGVAFSLK